MSPRTKAVAGKQNAKVPVGLVAVTEPSLKRSTGRGIRRNGNELRLSFTGKTAESGIATVMVATLIRQKIENTEWSWQLKRSNLMKDRNRLGVYHVSPEQPPAQMPWHANPKPSVLWQSKALHLGVESGSKLPFSPSQRPFWSVAGHF